MQINISLDSNSNISLQNQVFESIRKKILEGTLKSGMLMPSTRLMSGQLNVSRNTIIIAYEKLTDEGYIYTKKNVGTFVNPNLPEDSLVLKSKKQKNKTSPCRTTNVQTQLPLVFNGRIQHLFNPDREKLDIDFSVGRPDPDSFPRHAWRQLVIRHLSHSGSNMTEYHNPLGVFELRKSVTDHLQAARGIKARPEQLIIVNGIQQGINLVARLLIENGSTAVMECPCYQGAAFVIESYGARLYPVGVDEKGLDVSELPKKKVSLIYVTPSHQYPLGVTLTPGRRQRLLDWAHETGAYIIEDDYDSDFRHQGSPLTAVAGQDPYGCVIYMGTFSKSIGAALRLGYIVVPEALVESATIAKSLMDNGHSWLDQVVLNDFIGNGGYVKHLRKIRKTYIQRRDCLIQSLRDHFGDVKLTGIEGGMHLAWHLPPSLPTAEEVRKLALDAGVGVYSLSTGAAYDFGIKGYGRNALILGYSSTNEERIKGGIARINNALKA